MNRTHLTSTLRPDRQTTKKIEGLYSQYHLTRYIGMDPLITLQRFSDRADLELGGLIASVLAYGRVETIVQNIEELFALMDNKPTSFIVSTTYAGKRRLLKKFRHRFNTGDDMALFLQAVASIIKTDGSIEAFFVRSQPDSPQSTLEGAINAFSVEIKNTAQRINGSLPGYFAFLVPSPNNGSACKRMNMYLRWMVRPADGIDLGVWKSINPSQLLMPVDTHIARIARNEGMTKRTTADWRMAEEVTAWLRYIDKDDPVRFDFSLCRSGMVELRRSAA